MAVNFIPGFALVGDLPASGEPDAVSSNPIVTLFYALPNPALEHEAVEFFWTAPNTPKVMLKGGFNSGLLDNTRGYGLYTHAEGFTKPTDVMIYALDKSGAPLLVDGVPVTATVTVLMKFDTGERPTPQAFAGNIDIKRESYTCSDQDFTILVDASAYPITIHLLGGDKIPKGQIINVKKIDQSNNPVIVNGNGKSIKTVASDYGATETWKGGFEVLYASVIYLSSPMKGHCFQFDGEHWYII